MGGNAVQVLIGANIEGLIAGVEGVKGELEGLAEFTEGLTSTFTGLGEAFLAVFAAEKLESFVDHIVELGVVAERIQAQIGGTAENVAVLSLAADRSDLQISLLTRSMSTFARTASEAADGTTNAAKAYKLLDINVKEYLASGHTLNDLLELTTQRLSNYQDGLNKSAAISIIFGGRSSQLISTLNDLGKNAEELRRQISDAGGAIMNDFVPAAVETNAKMKVMDSAFEFVGENIFTVFKPAIDTIVTGMKDLASSFNQSIESGGAVPYVLGTISVAVDLVITGILGLVTLLEIVWNVGVMAFKDIADTAIHAGDAIQKAAHGHILEAMEEFNKIPQSINDNYEEAFKKAYEHEKDLYARIKGLWSNDPRKPEKTGDGGDDKMGIIDPAKVRSQMQVWEDSLTDMLLKKQEFGQEALQDELTFWQRKLQIAKAGSDDYFSIEKKIYEAEKQINAQRVRDEQKEEKERERIYDHFFQSFNSGLMSMIKGTGSWRDFLRNSFFNVLENGLKVMEKLLAHWIATEAAKTSATVAGNTARAASDQAAAKASSKGFGSQALAEIQGDAAKAYSGVYGFLAPEIGPFAAIPAAAAYVSVIGMEALVPSFDVGTWNVHRDGLAMLHENEKVLTASENLYGTGKDNGGGMQVHFHGGINDRAGIRALFMEEGPTLKRSMEKQGRLSHSKVNK